MSRTARLFDLLQALRGYRYPVSGADLAQKLGVSLRTLYRDIDTLRAQGADIEGEAGLGYVLRPGFMLPPLMLSLDEIEALTLGVQWVGINADPVMAVSARQAIAKLSAVIPDDVRQKLDQSAVKVMQTSAPHVRPSPEESEHLPLIREALRRERRLELRYATPDQPVSQRTVWPLMLAFFERARVLVTWCEWRQDFRNFRCDRIVSVAMRDDRYPDRRLSLIRKWREREGLDQT